MNLEEIRRSSVGGMIVAFELDEQLRYTWFRFLDRPASATPQMVGKRNSDLFPPEAAAEADRLMHQVMSSGAGLRTELAIPGLEGPSYFDLYIEPLQGGSGMPAGITCAAVDISRPRLLALRLVASNRLAAIGTLAAGLADDLSSPLTCLITNLRQALSAITEERQDESSRAHLAGRVSDALDGAIRIERMIRDLRACSRPEPPDLDDIELRQALEPAYRIVAGQAGRGTTIDVRWDPVPRVRGNSVRLGQVALNLLLNAAQARREDEGSIHLVRLATFASDDGWANFCVTDTGRGIPPEIRERIFDAFFSTRTDEGGTGLGLWICDRIVREHGGTITCDSKPMVGSGFRVALPPADHP